jgi:hypothetical protein
LALIPGFLSCFSSSDFSLRVLQATLPSHPHTLPLCHRLFHFLEIRKFALLLQKSFKVSSVAFNGMLAFQNKPYKLLGF